MYVELAWHKATGFRTRTSDVGVCRAYPKRLPGYDAVRIVLGLLLLRAAALKGHQLATEPTAETSLLTSGWLLISVVEFSVLSHYAFSLHCHI